MTGFLTRELRERSERVGFALETLDGRRGMLAHVSVRGGPRVGRYGVTHDDLERIAIPALGAQADVVEDTDRSREHVVRRAVAWVGIEMQERTSCSAGGKDSACPPALRRSH